MASPDSGDEEQVIPPQPFWDWFAAHFEWVDAKDQPTGLVVRLLQVKWGLLLSITGYPQQHIFYTPEEAKAIWEMYLVYHYGFRGGPTDGAEQYPEWRG